MAGSSCSRCLSPAPCRSGSQATPASRELWQFLLLGPALGVVGASFAVGTPYVARLFAKERRGFAMGVFGAGTTGAAINMLIAPALMARYGWQFVPKFYVVALLITALIFWLLSSPDVSAPGKSGVSHG